MSLDQETKKRGFDLYATEGVVRRLSLNLTAVKTGLEGYWIVELKDGKWSCDCINGHKDGNCEHIYAAQLAWRANKSLEKVETPNEPTLKCRYCGSPDIRRCGYRYNSLGINRRYFCNECERKFSMRLVNTETAVANVPPEVLWLINEIGTQTSRLNELLIQLDSKLTALAQAQDPAHETT
jgi:hypothetical protein